jgi:hypothetical protein
VLITAEMRHPAAASAEIQSGSLIKLVQTLELKSQVHSLWILFNWLEKNVVAIFLFS